MVPCGQCIHTYLTTIAACKPLVFQGLARYFQRVVKHVIYRWHTGPRWDK